MTYGSGRALEQDHFDLLPFIGIMMSLLGTLLLVTVSMAAINLGVGAGEAWIPQEGRAGQKAPVLIEWDGRMAVWHSETGSQAIEVDLNAYRRIGGRWFRVDPKFHVERVIGPQPRSVDSLLDYLADHSRTHYALFAVRPSGFESFQRFAWEFEDRHIEMGSEPIEQGKPVRLELPREKEAR